MARVFVSYRRDDSAYVAATINEKLEQRFGKDSVFFDIDTIPLGTDFRRHISEAVGTCDVLIVIIGDTWSSAVDDQGHRRLDSPTDYVRLEIEAALARDIPVVPVLVGRARMPTDLPSTLQDLVFRNAAEVRPGRDLPEHLTRLVTGLETLLQAPHPNRAVHELPRVDTTEGSAAAAEPHARESRARPSPHKRWISAALMLVAFFVGGVLAGMVVAKITGSSPAGFFLGTIPAWLGGIAQARRVWRQH